MMEYLSAVENSPEALMSDLAKRWLAHDGLWFLAVEQEYGMDAAIRADAAAWEKFTVVEAQRIRRFFGLPEDGGLDVLRQALALRLYRFVNQQETLAPAPDRIVFRMRNCRVQAARKRKNLPDFPCKPVGLVEYAGFARAVNPRIETRCLACPPDEHPEEFFCAWEFRLEGGGQSPGPAPDLLTAVVQSPERSLGFCQDLAKRWLAHDGLWFQAVEKEYGLAAAVRLDIAIWERFTVLEAERIRKLLRLPEAGGLDALARALPLRLEWLANRQELIERSEKRIVLRTSECRVQAARQKKNLSFFPCGPVGLAQSTGFARAIDPRIRTRCLACPPDPCPGGYCAWEFSL